jgi:AcrR family transcriptional regulator
MPEPFFVDPGDAPGKQAILRASLALFAEHGIDSTSVRDIGARAGFTNPALFRHFAGKGALAQQLFERIFRGFRACLPLVDDQPFEAQLRATLTAYLAFFESDLPAALYLQENLRRLWPRIPEELRQQSLIRHFKDLFRVGVRQGFISREDDPGLLVALLAGLLGQLARQLYFGETPGPATALLEDIHRLVLRGLTRGSAPGAPWQPPIQAF